ncbi:dTDP-glucose 4,6-dehydratase [Ensifer adhaerens]|nr:dTDP-glucose 4,6-dehydratase [Ensifer adhaerens]
MRVIVTGGAGFIGSALVRELVLAGHVEVLTIDKLTYAGNLASLEDVLNNPLHRFLKADICDRSAIEEAFQTFRPDWVIHLAAESHVDRSIADAQNFIGTNIIGSHVMLEAARSYWRAQPPDRALAFRFVHVSTDEVYGSLGPEGLFDEASPYDPSSPYSASKAASDHLARAWARTYGLPVIVSNCSNNYGPRQYPEKLIPLVILNALEGRPLPVYGSGANIRDWLYVEDHVQALLMIAERGRVGTTYNVGGRSERRNIDVVRSICAVMDEVRPTPTPYAALITYVPDRPGHDLRYAIDAGRIEAELGWKAGQNFDSGIKKTVKWYVENEWWWKPLRTGLKVDPFRAS